MKFRQRIHPTPENKTQDKAPPSRNNQQATTPQAPTSIVQRMPKGRGTRKIRRAAAARLASQIGNRAFVQRVVKPDNIQRQTVLGEDDILREQNQRLKLNLWITNTNIRAAKPLTAASHTSASWAATLAENPEAKNQAQWASSLAQQAMQFLSIAEVQSRSGAG